MLGYRRRQNPEVIWAKEKSNKERVGKKSNNLRPNVIYAFTVLKHIFMNKCQLKPSCDFALLLASCKSSVPYSLLAIETELWHKNNGLFKHLFISKGWCLS